MKRDTFIQMIIFKKKFIFVKIILVRLCLKALKSIKKLQDPSQTNSIENYVCFQVVGFKILRKSAKTKKMFENDHRKSHENENRPKNEAKMGISQSKAQVGSKSQWHMKD